MMTKPKDEPGWTILPGREAERQWVAKIEGDQFLNIFGEWYHTTPSKPFSSDVWYRRRNQPTELNHFI